MSLYYQGVYSFGATLSSASACATKLARFDGVEQISFMVGLALSPMVFQVGGYAGSFAVGVAGNCAAIVYLVFFTTGGRP